jgi:hypothetical protein
MCLEAAEKNNTYSDERRDIREGKGLGLKSEQLCNLLPPIHPERTTNTTPEQRIPSRSAHTTTKVAHLVTFYRQLF